MANRAPKDRTNSEGRRQSTRDATRGRTDFGGRRRARGARHDSQLPQVLASSSTRPTSHVQPKRRPTAVKPELSTSSEEKSEEEEECEEDEECEEESEEKEELVAPSP